MIRTQRAATRRATTAAIGIALLATAACGTDGDADATKSGADPGATGTEPIEIVAADYRFDGVPATVAAGTALTIRNRSAVELHELVARRLAADETRSARELVALPQDELGALFSGPPALVAIAPPEKESFAAVGDGKLTDPGRYLLLCFIPTGADPAAYLDAVKAAPGQPPSVAGGPPHVTAGMYAEVTVR